MREAWRQIIRGLACALVLAAAATLLAWAAGSPAAEIAVVRSNRDFESLLVAVTSFAIWACLLWFAATVILEASAKIPGLAGEVCARLSRRCAPAMLRASARWLVGATLLAAPLIAAPAMAASGGPSLDRPAATAANLSAVAARPALSANPSSPPARPATAAIPAAPASASASNIGPASSILLDRPVEPYLPPPPPPAGKTARDDGVLLLTGTAHRDAADDSYVVRRGDALWDIAARHLGPGATASDIAREWPRWYAANKALIGTNPNVIKPGEVLRAPGS